MKKLTSFILIFAFNNTLAQTSDKIITSDIDNFWVAYDSIQKTDALSKKVEFINKLYIDKASKGLKAFMELRDYDDSLYVNLIQEYPKFWSSVRPNTLSIKNKSASLIKAVEKLRTLYPQLKDAKMYFTIGGLRSGGTVAENMVLVGAEIATANQTTNASEFQNDWLRNVFAEQSLDNIVSLNIHEYVHTQQNTDVSDVLLNHVIREGACDFIAELVLEEPLQRKYITYGKEHFKELKQQFKEEMFSGSYANWLYNGGQRGESADLGYFIGYEICKSYYNRAEDKTKAIKEIIELDYSSDETTALFLKKSEFYEHGFDKEKLVKEYNSKRPAILRIEPFENGSTDIEPTATEFRILFSSEMNPKHYSLNYSEKGEDGWPIKKLIGFENNNQTLVLELTLEPEKEYEFIINCDGFSSKDGYPLKGGQYAVKFKTK